MKVMRKIVRIDEELCDGCGQCVIPCVEGAIEVINGKAKVLREELCDGAGFCLGLCPQGAISVEERVATPFSEEEARRQAETRQVSQQSILECYRCGTTEQDAALFPVRTQGRSEWVCARCLPQLIHG